MTEPPNKKSRSSLYASNGKPKRQRGKTSARQIRLRQRCNEALNHRLLGLTYRQIGKEMHCKPETAANYVLAAIKDAQVVPKEKVEDVLSLELERLDRMQAAVAKKAEEGDPGAIKLALRLMTMRARYLSLHPLPPTQSAALQINFPAAQGAPAFNIIGVQPDPADPKYYEPPLIEAQPPIEPLRPGLPKPEHNGPNILRFEKC